MRRVTLIDVDLDEVEAVVGPAFFVRGLDYARRNAVLSARWSSSEHALHGKVLDVDLASQHRKIYQTYLQGILPGPCPRQDSNLRHPL